ncbi:MAG: PKD domain-containing protein [Bacteroidota bacterium]
MKKLIRLAFILCCLFLQDQLFANTVIVKGYVTDSSNHAIANRTVKIYSTDSTNGGCVLSHTVVTNPNGYYIDTLHCTGDIRQLVVIVENCNGLKIYHTIQVGTTGIAESNFMICAPGATTPNISCKAVYSYTSLGTGVKFNAAGSATISGDSIISRTWTFGDSSTSLTGNSVDPAHTFSKAGSYNVCLTIHTQKGCSSSSCQTVVVKDTVPVTRPPVTNCKAQINFTKQGLTVKFTSANSYAPTGDSIISRTWLFGDSSTYLTGNRIDPYHVYAKAGTYTACLYIKTKSGCESKICAEIILQDSVPPVPTNCKAYFTYTIKDSLITFNSEGSIAASTDDSIISRTWYYSDNTTSVSLGGNVVSPYYKYAKPGSYPVYLVIKTKKGCESRYTVTVVIPPPPTNCKAYFTYTIKDSTITFNSEGSKATSDDDSIISRTWYYADNTTSVSLGGNVVSPSYKYAKPGSYPVYLVIKTRKGCESRYTVTVVIPPPPPACKAYFNFSVLDKSVVKFNSSYAKAAGEKDTIISRTWLFGDSTAPLQGNQVDPSHVYTKAGKYTVTLYIKTKSGCESSFTLTVALTSANCPVEAQFTAERVSLKKIQFNSSLSKAQAGDSIIQRNWKFGDNTILSGNDIMPVKEFSLLGIYNTCLQVRTLNGCEAQVCKQVIVQDTINTPQAAVDYIKIMSINPNPVITRMMATIYSRNSNTEAEITVYDIYGLPKLTIKRTLSQGNNIIEVGCEALYHGPYFLKVSTRNGRDSKAFYKL